MVNDDFDSVFKIVNETFGTLATYTYAIDSTTSQLKGVFDNAYVEVLGVGSKKPIFKIRLSDLNVEPTKGDSLNINSNNYKVIYHEPDGLGTSILVLEKI